MLRLNRAYQSILKTDKRYILVTGGRGSAKSFHVQSAVCLLSYEKGHTILNMRYTLTNASDSIIPEFEEKIEGFEVPHHFYSRGANMYNTKSGSKILFRGMRTSSGNQTAKLKGTKGLSIVVLDEAEELVGADSPDEIDDFDKLDYSMREKGVRNQWILVFNPPYIGHILWKKFFDGQHKYIDIEGYKVPISTHPNVHHIHTTYHDNLANLNGDYLDLVNQLKIRQPTKYGRQVIGTWLEDTEGVIFSNWEEAPFDESIPHLYGLDYGFWPDPLALVEVAVDFRNYRIYVREKMYGTRMSVEQVKKGLGESLRRPNDLIICDTDEARTTYQLKMAGFNIMKAKKGPGSVKADLIEIQDWTLVIDPGSHNIKRERALYLWDDKRSSVPIGEHDHTLKAIIYAWRRRVGIHSTKR